MGASLAKAKAPHGLVCRQLGLNGVPAGANPTFGETKTLDYISSFSVKNGVKNTSHEETSQSHVIFGRQKQFNPALMGAPTC